VNNHTVTKHDKDDHFNETIIGEGLTFYEAISLVVDSRGLKDGNFYRIGKPYNLKKEGKY
jgi:hypothetical protein